MKLLFRIALVGFAALLAAEQPRSGLIRGVVLDLTPGFVSVRSAPGDIYRFSFDSHTWIERSLERVPGTSLRKGELLEVISDRGGDYARLIHVLTAAPKRSTGRSTLGNEHLSVTYTGVVVGGSGEVRLLKTRFDGVKTLYLRQDTRCLFRGDEVDRSLLVPHTQVWVEAISNSDAELEALRIVWGEIIHP